MADEGVSNVQRRERLLPGQKCFAIRRFHSSPGFPGVQRSLQDKVTPVRTGHMASYRREVCVFVVFMGVPAFGQRSGA